MVMRWTPLYALQKSGGAVDCCQVTVVFAAAPVPMMLVADTPYVTAPAELLVATHVDVVLEQPVQL